MCAVPRQLPSGPPVKSQRSLLSDEPPVTKPERNVVQRAARITCDRSDGFRQLDEFPPILKLSYCFLAGHRACLLLKHAAVGI